MWRWFRKLLFIVMLVCLFVLIVCGLNDVFSLVLGDGEFGELKKVVLCLKWVY